MTRLLVCIAGDSLWTDISIDSMNVCISDSLSRNKSQVDVVGAHRLQAGQDLREWRHDQILGLPGGNDNDDHANVCKRQAGCV